jgi:quercetin dioxygenase-like cupin family protein
MLQASQSTSQTQRKRGMHKQKALLVAAIGLAGVAIFGVTALATSGVGFSGDPNPALRGTLTHDVQLNSDRIKFQTKDETDIAVQTVTILGGGNSGWHYHPGFLLAVVQSGSVTLTVGCTASTYSAGQSFYETGTTPTIARNASATDSAVVRVTYIVPKGMPTRIDVPASQIPVC